MSCFWSSQYYSSTSSLFLFCSHKIGHPPLQNAYLLFVFLSLSTLPFFYMQIWPSARGPETTFYFFLALLSMNNYSSDIKRVYYFIQSLRNNVYVIVLHVLYNFALFRPDTCILPANCVPEIYRSERISKNCQWTTQIKVCGTNDSLPCSELIYIKAVVAIQDNRIFVHRQPTASNKFRE